MFNENLVEYNTIRVGELYHMTYPVKRLFSKIAITMLLYEIIFQVGGSFMVEYGSNIYRNENFSMMIAGFISLTVSLLMLGTENIHVRYKKFNIVTFIYLLLLIYGIQYLSKYIINPLQSILGELGYSLDNARDLATGSDIKGFWAIVYAVIMAPLLEECFFRGILYGHFRKYGKIFAITITSFLFGLMHFNLVQFIAAMFIGIVFAWIRETYGLKYSILMHMANNSVALLPYLYKGDSIVIDVAYFFLLFGGALLLVISVIRNFKVFLRDLSEEPSLGHMYKLWFTTFSVIVVTILFVVITLFSITV